ncbi:MAG: hypothetical protein ACE5KS_06150 [Woeseiaceae bacterium]
MNRGTGQVIFASKPHVRSASDQLVEIVQIFSNYFDRRPKVTGGFRLQNDQEAHIFFGSVFGGQPVLGVMRSSIDAAGVGTAGIVFDRAKVASTTINELMAMLDRATGRGQSAPGQAGGVIRPQNVQWYVAPFPDGSGQIKLPHGFRITSAYQGAVDIAGPQGEAMQLGYGYPVATPESAINPLTGQPMQGGALVAPAGLDPVRALTTIVPQIIAGARRLNPQAPVLQITRIIEWAPTQSATGGRAGFILWEFLLNGVLYRALTLVDVSPPASGYWVYYTSGVAAPRERFNQILPVMMHSWQSGWRIDPRVFQARLNAAYRTMRETHQIMMQTMQGSSQRVHDKLSDWSEVFRGQRIVRDRTTGWEFTTDTGWANRTVDELNRRAGWQKYEQIPLGDWWGGR